MLRFPFLLSEAQLDKKVYLRVNLCVIVIAKNLKTKSRNLNITNILIITIQASKKLFR